MNEEQTVNDLSSWFSTYGVITAQRLLERYRIKLKDDDLIYALKTPNSFYNSLLRIPLKNVFNGIIMQQVRDYQVYSQKLFVDYLLSGEDAKVEEAPGAGTREAMETERKALMELGNDFHQHELDQERLIAESQAILIKHAETWQKKIASMAEELKTGFAKTGVDLSADKAKRALTTLLTQYNFNDDLSSVSPERWKRVEEILSTPITKDIKQLFIQVMSGLSGFAENNDQAMADFGFKITQMNTNLRDFRTQFTGLIVRVTDLSQLLPDYQADIAQTNENKEQLHFNSHLGEETK